MEELQLAGSLFDLGETPEQVHNEFQNRGFGVPLKVLKAYKIYWNTENKTDDDFIAALYHTYLNNQGPFRDFGEYLHYIKDPDFIEMSELKDSSKMNKKNPYFLISFLKKENRKAGLNYEFDELYRGLELIEELREA